MFSLVLDSQVLTKIHETDPTQTIIPFQDGFLIKKFEIFDKVDFYKKLKQVLITFNHDHPKILCIKGLYTDINENNLKILTLLPAMKENLKTRIQSFQKKGERFHKDQIIEYAYNLIDIHDYLQTKGISNGNLKLTNILFQDDEIYVSDVGLKKSTDPKIKNDIPFGDPDYLAPEILQASNKLSLSQDAIMKGDIWTIGLILMEICLLEKVRLPNIPIELRIGNCLEKIQEFYGSKLKTLIENMVWIDPKKRLPFKESRTYMEHTILNSMLTGFNKYINPLTCMSQIAVFY